LSVDDLSRARGLSFSALAFGFGAAAIATSPGRRRRTTKKCIPRGIGIVQIMIGIVGMIGSIRQMTGPFRIPARRAPEERLPGSRLSKYGGR
jgi:hypothetical protein